MLMRRGTIYGQKTVRAVSLSKVINAHVEVDAIDFGSGSSIQTYLPFFWLTILTVVAV